ADFHADLDQKLAIVPGAAFDSYENQHKDECLPGTRTDILNQIKEWAASPYREAIFWLYGIAGTGKSTISRTIAKSFSETRSLGASFFFERGEGDRGNARKLFPTIARQLAIIHPLLMPILHEAVNDNPGIAAKGLREQFDKLLFQPFKKLPLSDTSLQSVVIVIDALDECEGDGDIQLILQLLPQLQRVTTMRLQVLLTSRPDLSRFVFSKMKLDHYKDFILHNIPLEVIEHDITLFFCHRLPEIRVLHNLPTDWPGKRDLQRLITLSIPSFIFAATICRIFEELDWDPADSLSSIFTQQDDRTRLTGTYLPVLDRLLNRQNKNQKEQLVMQFRQIIGAIVVLETSLSIGALSRLLGISQRLIHLRLNPLQSVLRVPDNDITPIRLFHLSFREFLLDPVTRTKTPLGISEIETHNMLTKKCLQICQKLEENICQLPNYGSQNVEIDRQTINEYFPPELQYGCRYWAHHLVQCTELTNIAYEAYSFLQTHLLLWIEAMSLLGHALEISGIIDLLQTAIGGNAPPLILQFFHDAKRFVLKSQHIFDQAPLQVYRAGLVFLPQASIIRTIFADKHSHWISQCPLVNETWSAELQALEGHSDSVLSVAFSPDGYLLASGSKDQTVYLWDPATGTIIQILDGHSGPVNSLSFSSDSHRLATGSDDKTLRVWDLATGEELYVLEGHSNSVLSVSFSPDDRLLASGSKDQTVNLWDPATGTIIQILDGHSGPVNSLSFSSDSRRLATGSDDKTLRVWDLATGEELYVLEGHSNSVLSVSFSPDDRLLASGSEDQTVRLWDTARGSLKQTLDIYSSSFNSVVFSPDGEVLATGSANWVVRLWDLATSTLQKTIDGHMSLGFTLSAASESVAFSPDSQLLASCSADETVRLWDPMVSEITETLNEDDLEPPVDVMAFSPDGLFLASGSFESPVVCLWNTTTGALTHTLEGHSQPVTSVTFSPDSRILASSSADGTSRLWVLPIGTLKQTLRPQYGSVHSVAFSCDGRLLASCTDDGKVCIWDLTRGTIYQTIDCHSESAYSAIFSSDSSLLVVGTDDGILRVFDVATVELYHEVDGHSDWVNSLAFSPDNRLLASWSMDETVCLWAFDKGGLSEIWTYEITDDAYGFFQDGLYLQIGLSPLDVEMSFTNSVFPNISIEDGQWINLDGKRILWLPVDFRPKRFKVNGNKLALGHASGKVSFLQFCI
ncbi:NACHT and WD40 domain protein, partial [Penicillium citrinum]